MKIKDIGGIKDASGKMIRIGWEEAPFFNVSGPRQVYISSPNCGWTKQEGVLYNTTKEAFEWLEKNKDKLKKPIKDCLFG